MLEQIIVFITLFAALVLFVWGRWRYDIVALLALLMVTLTGIVPAEEAFLGFGHPAVVTVAAVLVISRGLINAGLIDLLSRQFARVGNEPGRQITIMTGVVAVISAFINNIGAVAMMMPVAVQRARKSGYSPSLLLMPMAAGSLLGGLITLIGTPPNIIIATYRAQTVGEPFRMFDFTPVGLGVTIAGVVFISVVGWRLIPEREAQRSRDELFDIADYTAELRITEESPLVGKHLRAVYAESDANVVVATLVRGDHPRPAPPVFETLRTDDVLVVEADSESLKEFVEENKLEMVGSDAFNEELLGSDEVSLVEAVVAPSSIMVNRTVKDLHLRQRHALNLLAVARHGQRLKSRLDRIRLQGGDVLLLQGAQEALPDTLRELDLLPLAERELRLGQPRKVVLSLTIFGLAIALAAVGILAVQVAFVAAAIVMVMAGLLSLRQAYESINWPIIILLGALIPVGEALEATGGAARIAEALLGLSGQFPPVVTLSIVMLVTMLLSNIINNAAAAVLMAPIGISLASGFGVSADPFLMAVAIAAASAFLTPIGHQSYTLVMGPGGYRFGDYWRMGLPLMIVVIIVAIPLIMLFWPF